MFFKYLFWKAVVEFLDFWSFFIISFLTKFCDQNFTKTFFSLFPNFSERFKAPRSLKAPHHNAKKNIKKIDQFFFVLDFSKFVFQFTSTKMFDLKLICIGSFFAQFSKINYRENIFVVFARTAKSKKKQFWALFVRNILCLSPRNKKLLHCLFFLEDQHKKRKIERKKKWKDSKKDFLKDKVYDYIFW